MRWEVRVKRVQTSGYQGTANCQLSEDTEQCSVIVSARYIMCVRVYRKAMVATPRTELDQSEGQRRRTTTTAKNQPG